MWLSVLLIVISIGILTAPLGFHISIKEKNTYLEARISVTLLGCVLFKRQWQKDCLHLITDILRKEATKSAHRNKRVHLLKLIFGLLYIGRWQKIVWRSEVGLDDASHTALTVGGISIVQASLRQSCISCGISKAVLHCRPNFRERTIKNDILCILTFRIGNIIKEFARGYLEKKWRRVS